MQWPAVQTVSPAGVLTTLPEQLKVELPAGDIDEVYVEKIAEAFNIAYERRYGYRDAHASIEGVDWELVTRIGNSRTELAGFALSGKQGAARAGA